MLGKASTAELDPRQGLSQEHSNCLHEGSALLTLAVTLKPAS